MPENLNNMNDYSFVEARDRKKTLVITEGELEKKQLLSAILTCFPEIPIEYEDIHVYKTNLYNLYNDIVNEYGDSWDDDGIEIDLLLLFSRKMSNTQGQNTYTKYDKRDFNNIILTFDYEHHDSFYTDEKVLRLQKHFNSMTDDGILLLNYPMIEAIFHVTSFPDKEYLTRTVSVNCKPGRVYKALVRDESAFMGCFETFESIKESLSENHRLLNKQIITLMRKLLGIDTSVKDIKGIMKDCFCETGYSGKKLESLCYSIPNRIRKVNNFGEDSMLETMRKIIVYLVGENIKKAYYVQYGEVSKKPSVKEMYYSLDWLKVLERQNRDSSDANTGVIWVLCALVTFVAEYKFFSEVYYERCIDCANDGV